MAIFGQHSSQQLVFINLIGAAENPHVRRLWSIKHSTRLNSGHQVTAHALCTRNWTAVGTYKTEPRQGKVEGGAVKSRQSLFATCKYSYVATWHLGGNYQCYNNEWNLIFTQYSSGIYRSQWLRSPKHRSAAVRLLRLWVRIPRGAWMFVCCVCCQVEVSATSWSLVQRNPTDCDASLCDLETSRMRRPWPAAPRGGGLVVVYKE